ncbi:MAG: hypothetical protein AAF090_02640 [Bacteroidota bacterium]
MAKDILLQILKEYYIPLYLLTWVVAMIRFKRYDDTVLKHLPIFIIYTFFTELLGYFIKFHEDFQFFSAEGTDWHNVIIFNIYQVVTFAYFFWVYYKVCLLQENKRRIKFLAIGTFSSYFISLFFQDPFHIGLYYADLVGSLSLVVIIILYFMEKTKKTVKYPVMNNLMFWVSLGLLVFYCLFPFVQLIGYTKYEIWVEYHFQTVLSILIVTMYILFNIGFIFGKKKAFT